MDMKKGWVGIHKCGGLIEAVPNGGNEKYKCSVSGCSGLLQNEEYHLFQSEDLPNGIEPVAVKSMSRDDRHQIAQVSEDEALELIQSFVNEGRVNIF